MGGFDVDAPVERKTVKGRRFTLTEHANRDMQHMLDTILSMASLYEIHLSDERAVLRQITADHGLRWPDETV